MKRAIVVILSALVLVLSLLSYMPVIAGASYEGFTYDRSGNESAAHDVTSITVAKPGDTVEGDLLIGVVITDGDTSDEFTAPTGWTLINEGWSGEGDFSGCTLGAWYRVAGGSEPTTYTWNWTSAETVYAFIIRITGHNTDNPIDVWGFNTGVNDMTPTCPDVTTTVADTLVLRIFGYDSCYGWNATYPDEHTGITVESSRPGCEAGAQGHCSGGAAYATQATAGAIGTASFQVTDGQSFWAWRTLTIAVRPVPVQYDLTMAADPEEGGTATDLTNESPYAENTVVSIKAEANEGYEFVNWTATAGEFEDDEAAETTFTMPAQDVTVTATFTLEQYTLTVNIVGNGSVVKDPDQPTYTYDTSVALNAIPDPCWSFDGWSGDLNGTENPTSIIMNGNKTVTATFTPVDCDYLDGWVEDGSPYTTCNGTDVCTYQDMVYLDYECVGGECVSTETNWRTDLIGCESCDDGIACTIDECQGGVCTHTPDDSLCSADEWVDTGSTQWVEDTPCTEKEQKEQEYRDYYCDEAIGCTYNITGTQWVDTGSNRNKADGTPCSDDGIGCTIDECQGGVCTHTPDDSLCSADEWVDTDNTQWVEDTPCTEKEQKEQEYRDYYCDEAIGCTYNVTGTQWVDTGSTRNKADGTPCSDDGIGCTIDECQGGVCTHTPDDSLCSADEWVDTGNTQWVEDTPCTEKEQKEQEYRDYYCDEAIGCTYNITGTQWVDTGSNRNKADGTPCPDDGDLCTIDECQGGVCVHIPAAPTATASSNSPVSQGATIQLTGGPDDMASYNWTGPGGWTSSLQDPTRPNATTAMAGTYTLAVTNSSGCTDDVTTNVEVLSSPVYPTVTTQTATGVTTNSATLSMSYTVGDFSPVYVRFTYKKYLCKETSRVYTDWVSKSESGTFAKSLTGLDDGTVYEFKTQIKYGDTVIEGNTLYFTIAKSSLPPSEGCFIATAAYGTPSAEQIDVLREFRDTVLLESTVGSQFVALYYQLSPPVAEFIAGNELLRTMVRELLVDPIVGVVEATGNMWRN